MATPPDQMAALVDRLDARQDRRELHFHWVVGTHEPRLLVLGERHLRRAIGEFVAQYHGERNHQGLGNELIQLVGLSATSGPVRRRQRMDGMLNYYYRAA